MNEPELGSAITCPHCGQLSVETMPVNACIVFWPCPHCAAVLRPLAGRCCVFCSYGTTPCPPVQASKACCG
ncbi:MAG: hypothetical protein ISP90_11960 [Nevskia sp.]|nr:hypothetical protein [Nevskia sp.]